MADIDQIRKDINVMVFERLYSEFDIEGQEAAFIALQCELAALQAMSLLAAFQLRNEP